RAADLVRQGVTRILLTRCCQERHAITARLGQGAGRTYVINGRAVRLNTAGFGGIKPARHCRYRWLEPQGPGISTMRRADRLFQIVEHLRGGRLVTAQKVGGWLEVSERTIYRDIADLQSTGVPIDGEAGVGYMMREGFDLPPLMFTRDEIVALVAGARMVRAFGGAAMARAAEEALVKIGAVLPDAEKDRIARTEIHAPMWVVSDADRAHIDRIERAVEKREVLTLDYRDEAGRPSARDVRPLGLWFWG